MATVGHGLVGLALAGMSPRHPRGVRGSFLLPGALVLLAYAVDLAEWLGVALDPQRFDRRFASHSLPWITSIVFGACVSMGLVLRLRRASYYVLIASAVLSHVILDRRSVRVGLLELYLDRSGEGLSFPFRDAALAEIWLYGLPVVLVLLGRGALSHGAPPRARSVAAVAAVACLGGALLRHAAAWVPAYILSTLYAAVLLRRDLRGRLLWNLALLIPIGALAVTSAVAVDRQKTARSLKDAGMYPEAIAAYQRALTVPSREARTFIYLEMGMCYEHLGDLDTAERMYSMAGAVEEHPGWPGILRARLYHRYRNSVYYQPGEAERQYRELENAPDLPTHLRATVRRALEQLATDGDPGR